MNFRLIKDILKDLVLGEKPRKIQRDNPAPLLEKFVQQIYWAEDMTSEQSKRNIHEGLVELICHGHHSSNGLLITNNGYFITAGHCLDLRSPEVRVRLSDGRDYNIERICFLRNSEDFALAKANIPGEAEPRHYKFFSRFNFEKTLPAAMLSKWDGQIQSKYGFLRPFHGYGPTRPLNSKTLTDYRHHYISSLPSIPGDSGGIVVNDEGRIMGIHSAGCREISQSLCLKFIRALELIEHYRAIVQSRK
jgi:hypothetical protein